MAARTCVEQNKVDKSVKRLNLKAEMWWLEIEIPPPGAGIVIELNAYNSGVN